MLLGGLVYRIFRADNVFIGNDRFIKIAFLKNLRNCICTNLYFDAIRKENNHLPVVAKVPFSGWKGKKYLHNVVATMLLNVIVKILDFKYKLNYVHIKDICTKIQKGISKTK